MKNKLKLLSSDIFNATLYEMGSNLKVGRNAKLWIINREIRNG